MYANSLHNPCLLPEILLCIKRWAKNCSQKVVKDNRILPSTSFGFFFEPGPMNNSLNESN